MIYLYIALGGVAAVVVVPMITGLLLPERYLGQLKVVFPKPPDDVWAALADFEKHPMTGKMMKSIEKLPDENGLKTWIEDMGHGACQESFLSRGTKSARNGLHQLDAESSSRAPPAGAARASLPLRHQWVH